MRANITNESELFKALEAKLGKDIDCIRQGQDEDHIYFKDGSSTYAIFEAVFGKTLSVVVTLLNDDFDFIDKITIDC